MSRWQEPQSDIDTCGFPRISTAPGDLRNWTDAAIVAESRKLYASMNSEGKIFLIQNPACWPRKEIRPMVFVRVPPKPIPLNEYQGTPRERELAEDKAEDFIKW